VPRLHTVLASASLLLCMIPASALAQERSDARASSSSLPYAPLPKLDPQNLAQQTPAAEGSASVTGTVLDVSGATVSGADVGLMHGNGTQLHTMVSEAKGEFNFTKLPAGSYLVTVNARGFAPL
jgi:carboxypeptidase family protein